MTTVASVLHVLLNVAETILAVVGLAVNVYIVVALIFARQLKNPCNILLLHLGALHTLTSLLFLTICAPSLFSGDGFIGNSVVCAIQGFVFAFVLPLSVWNLAGIHLDRFVSIAYPLR